MVARRSSPMSMLASLFPPHVDEAGASMMLVGAAFVVTLLLPSVYTPRTGSAAFFPFPNTVSRHHAGRVPAGGNLEREGHRALLSQGLSAVSSHPAYRKAMHKIQTTGPKSRRIVFPLTNQELVRHSRVEVTNLSTRRSQWSDRNGRNAKCPSPTPARALTHSYSHATNVIGTRPKKCVVD